jgi:hypothetical protein
MNIKKRILEISAEIAAICGRPKRPATNAITKKIIAHVNIN